MTLTLSFSIVNILIFRLGEIRSHMIETISVMSTLTMSPGPESRTCSRYYHTHKCVKLYPSQLINAGAREMRKIFFSKNSHGYLDLEPSKLRAELAQDITISNSFVKIY